ncbi:tetratricopeptide repeat protein 28-like isoform X2 [Montipora capricornis]|uniref:tetratricopeptide repeat protein 28-like isoform X1 n=1 Tax=Montipora capricornis TaxID=246305 RepID=UPI0035F1D417
MVETKLEAIEQLMLGLAIAISEGDRDLELRAYYHLGDAYVNLPDYQEAIQNYTEALHILREKGCRAEEGVVSCILGNVYLKLGNFKQAIEHFEKRLSIAKEVADRAGEGSAYRNLGNAYHRLGNLKQAIKYYEKHLSIAKEVGDRAGEGSTYGNLGNAYRNVGNFRPAIEYCQKYLSIAKEVGDRAGEGSAYGNLGIAYLNMGNFKIAIAYFEKDLTIAKEVGDRAGEGSTYGNLGNAYCSLGNLKRAIEYNEKHLSIAKEVGDRAGEGSAYGNLGNAYLNMGNFKQAIEYYEKHLSIAKEVADRAGEGSAYGNLGNAYLNLSNFKQAIEYYENDLSIAKEVGDRAGEGLAYGNLGNAYLYLVNFKQAIKYYKKHLSIAKEVADRAGEGSAYGNLGNAYLSLGNFKQAIENYKKHLSIAKEVGDRAGEGLAYGNLGGAFCSVGNVKQAIKYHENNLSICKETGTRVQEGVACFSLGYAHELSGSLSKALSCYHLSVKQFDETRHSLKSNDEWKIRFRDSYRLAYTALWRTLLKNGEVDEALYAAEKGRAQALLDILTEQYDIDYQCFSALSLKQILSAALELLPSQAVFVALDGNNITFWVLRKDRRINFRQSEIAYEGADKLMKTILKMIGVGDGVRCEDRSLDPLRSNLSCSRQSVSEKTVLSSSSSVNSLQLLYDVLLGPIADLLQGDELIVVPDGPFCLAPFSALSKTMRIRTVPSLTAFNLIAGAPEVFHSKTGALLVGDPWLKEVINKRGEPIFKQLPCAKEEVEMIGELMQTTPLMERNATKTEVLKRMKSVALVHIAAHGCPTTGEIALAPNTERKSPVPKEEEYILKMCEVQAISLRARLVVLSCCHSGRGEVKSEGVVGIARAFLCAGARSVLVSLWAIDDKVTLLFMRSFYQHLVDGKSASEALQQAIKFLRESKQYCAIKNWAPFMLIGDDVTLEFPKK